MIYRKVINRKFKEYWSTITIILTKRTTTSQLTQFNTKRPSHMELEIQGYDS